MSERKYCTKCGAPLAEGALYCSRCGTAVSQNPNTPQAPGPAVPPPPAPESYRYGEKYEKHEKHEKREKGEKAEKGGGRAPWVGPLFGGLIVIWLGFTFLLAASGTILWVDWWRWFLVGLGILLVVDGLILSVVRGRAYPFIGFFIGGIIVFLIGLVPFGVVAASTLWPLFIIVIGVIIIIGVLVGRRRVPPP